MPASRKVQGFRYLPLCLLLLSFGGAMAGTREVRLHGPNGDGGDCTEAASTTPADTDSAATGKPAVAATKHAASKIKPVITVRSGGDDGVTHAPRWHSFLPGMFR